MYICMYVYIYVYIYIYIYLFMFIFIFIFTYIYIYIILIYIYMHTQKTGTLWECVFLRFRPLANPKLQTTESAYTRVCIHIYTHIYTHTYTYKHIYIYIYLSLSLTLSGDGSRPTSPRTTEIAECHQADSPTTVHCWLPLGSGRLAQQN